MLLIPGSRLGPYEIVASLGAGGMGEVYRAHDIRLRRDVAIKVLPAEFAQDPERLARFEREARLLASISHPNIAGLHGIEVAEGHGYLVIEFVQGETLAARLSRGALPLDEAVEVAKQIAAGMEAAHENGVVHRDLKPANVMLTPADAVKVLDFGLARWGATERSGSDRNESASTITNASMQTGVILGTAAYMSPEQARGKSVDRRTDIWAFGCVLYECLTGRRAFAGETVSDTIAKILERDPDLGALPGATPPRVRELLRRCFDKDPKHRLRDIGDARIVLEEVLAARSPSEHLLTPEVSGQGTARLRGSLLAVAIAGAIGLGVGVGLWSKLGPRSSEGRDGQPTCVTVAMPSDVTVSEAMLTHDGRTLVVRGWPKSPEASPLRAYTRRLDRYDFKELPGTEGVIDSWPDKDSRSLTFISPVLPVYRLARIPLDGSAPATTWVDWKDSWLGGRGTYGRFRGVVELENGDLLIQDSPATFVRLPRAGNKVSPPVKIDVGRSGVLRYEFTGATLPGDRGAFVNVISYDARGFHYGAGVMNSQSGRVKILVEDGGNSCYSPTGHLLFARGDAVMAMRFDPRRVEVHGEAVAIWDGLTAPSTAPGRFLLTDAGALFYRPGVRGGGRELAFLDTTGKLESWSPERPEVYDLLQPSPDGRRFACAMDNVRGVAEIWVSDLSNPNLQRLGTDPNADCMRPLWSPDGKRIAYTRRGSDGRDGVYIQSVDGGEAKRVLKPESDQVSYYPNSWLPDGSALLVLRSATGQTGLAMLPLTGGEADSTGLRPLLPSASLQAQPMISPDGRLLAYVSGQVYVVELSADGSIGSPVQVKIAGWRSWAWSADGRTLFVRDGRDRLVKVAVTTEPKVSVSGPTEVYDFDKLRVAMWSVLPDGRFFVGLRNENEEEITRYHLVLNWTAVLKRKMGSDR